MFLRYFVELDLPAARAEAALLDSPAAWLPALADGAVERAEPLLAEVGVGQGGLRVARRVTVRLGQPVRFPSKFVLPMRWEPSGWLLPTLDGELEVGALGRHRTQLALSGNYEPPLGTVGRTVDRLALHRIAEATIKDFLDRVGTAVSTPPRVPRVGTIGHRSQDVRHPTAHRPPDSVGPHASDVNDPPR